ncbi:hypothetical protein V5O48_011547 [Marasmius crinis-equi]|uniref:Uncharacterized protein n=1 Tax=Marasmius crinis-equi TaxID=585013 RepID=A0ABR3F585_9AGAR
MSRSQSRSDEPRNTSSRIGSHGEQVQEHDEEVGLQWHPEDDIEEAGEGFEEEQGLNDETLSSGTSEEERAHTAVSPTSTSSRTKKRRSRSTRHSSSSSSHPDLDLDPQRQLIQDLERNLGKQTHRLMQLELTNERLEQTLSSQRREAKRATGEITELESSLQESREALESYQDEIEDAVQEIAGLRNDIGDQAATIAALNEDIEAQMKENEKWKKEVEEMKRVMDKKDRMLIDERGVKAKKAAEVVETLAELLKVKQENTRLHGLVVELSRRVEQSAETYEKGKGRAIDNEDSVPTKNVSSPPFTAARDSENDEPLHLPPTPVFTRPDVAGSPRTSRNPFSYTSSDLAPFLDHRASSRTMLEEEILRIADVLMDPSPVKDPAALEMVTKLIKALALAYFVVEVDDGVIERAEQELRMQGGSPSLGDGTARGEVRVAELKERLTQGEALSTREADTLTKNSTAAPRVGSPSTSKTPTSRSSFPLATAPATFSFRFGSAGGSGTGD